jgi:glycosyltransferase involved in cell wall biosynthesis
MWSYEEAVPEEKEWRGVHVYATLQSKTDHLSLWEKVVYNLRLVRQRYQLINKILREQNCNLVVVLNSLLDATIAYYLKRTRGIPFVFVLSNPLEQDWEFAKVDRPKPEFVYRWFYAIRRWYTMRLLARADLIQPISIWLEHHLAEQGLKGSKFLPVSEGIDPHEFHVPERGDYPEPVNPVILYVGSLDKMRGLSVLIRAFKRVAEHDETAILWVVGEGNDQKDLGTLVEELQIGERVFFLGRIPHGDIPAYIARATICVSPIQPFSFYKYSSPIKIYEYMMLGKPIVANREIPEHEKCLIEAQSGILVPFTPEGFADALVNLLRDPARALEMGQKGKKWILEGHTHEALARILESRYRTIVR